MEREDRGSQALEGLLPPRMISGFSHSLRNSLNAIGLTLMNVGRLLKKESQVRRAAELLEQVRLASEEVEVARGTVTAFVDLLRPVRLSEGHVDIAARLAALVEREREHVSAHGIGGVEVHLEVQAHPSGQLDGEKLDEAAGALVRNGIEAVAAGGGAVQVTLEEKDGAAVITVRDGGGGFSETALDRCFDLFYTDKVERVGLGLTRARRLARAMGGDVELLSGAGEPGAVRLTLRPGAAAG